MVDITQKQNTLRIAIAQATVKVSRHATIDAIEQGTVPKGDVFAMSKAAGLLGVKKTPELLPDCHPLPIEATSIEYTIRGLEIDIKVTVKTIYKTGVEVEAMHGASIVALNMYDMLKPIDKGVEIQHIKLLEKRGGKSDLNSSGAHLKAAVIVCSDSISEGKNEDRSGQALVALLEAHEVAIEDYSVIPDDHDGIQEKATQCVTKKIPLIIFTGGTGLSPTDITPEALQPLIERPVPGIEEVIRRYGQERTPLAMLSRSVAGMIGNSLVLAVPGSTKGAQESLQALLPAVFHIFHIAEGGSH
ncbi:bifunctional molybdenum cofactor biosynthesis protein MoaC/MoaB [Altibacter sp. HG106]|uniref:bifunctional molybdenum cofactor biosynthesis protein MoaC/MoaB n=1 Tax=Altibacter sp. HG106 TaxID=3023937 RepID=UPI002350D891|nr:bifunctional molybdenum cofactor biosynthesis protein MoaC/MoaB [Altibacter sp. HG106]MDC7995336.1 bifunctional molybdenum cofactor biosynthesis protein MoaC/MoaB [Altibacter sp. HG106]